MILDYVVELVLSHIISDSELLFRDPVKESLNAKFPRTRKEGPSLLLVS